MSKEAIIVTTDEILLGLYKGVEEVTDKKVTDKKVIHYVVVDALKEIEKVLMHFLDQEKHNIDEIQLIGDCNMCLVTTYRFLEKLFPFHSTEEPSDQHISLYDTIFTYQDGGGKTKKPTKKPTQGNKKQNKKIKQT